MAAEGEFPKSDGDKLYASEVNAFEDKLDTPIFSDTTDRTNAGTSLATVRTLTIGGSFSGAKVIFLCVKGKVVTGGATATFYVASDESGALHNNSFPWAPGTNYVSIPILVVDGQAIYLRTAGSVVGTGTDEIYVYTSNQSVTVTGS